MLDFARIEKYKENNRIEAKKALGGLPESIWETYSSFANTLGGVILLGVEEYKDKSFHAVDLPDPYGMVKKFYEGLNDSRKVNVNILPAGNVSVLKVDGKRIISIEVPRASRYDRPIYINGDMEKGVYRRGGEGDFRCTPEEIAAMVRDASVITSDMKPLEKDDFILNAGSVAHYKRLFAELRPGHVYLTETDGEFLIRIGAAVKNGNGKLYPTVAGALMFGVQKSITDVFPEFFLSLRCEDEMGNISFSKGRGGNLFDFYLETVEKIKNAFSKKWTNGEEITNAVLEAVVNGMTNADYHRGGVSVSLCPDGAKVTNSGGFRVNAERAKKGEVSDPRNAGLFAMLNFVNAGKGMGKGIVGIYDLWHRNGWSKPLIRESFEPEKTMVEMPFGTVNDSRALFDDNPFFRYSVYKEEIIYFLTKNIAGSFSEIAAYIEGDQREISAVLCEMVRDEIISEEKSGELGLYRMRS